MMNNRPYVLAALFIYFLSYASAGFLGHASTRKDNDTGPDVVLRPTTPGEGPGINAADLNLNFKIDPAIYKEPIDFVDPFIGTTAGGHVFPGATLPFGKSMKPWSFIRQRRDTDWAQAWQKLLQTPRQKTREDIRLNQVISSASLTCTTLEPEAHRPWDFSHFGR
jgi:hypothetical protein